MNVDLIGAEARRCGLITLTSPLIAGGLIFVAAWLAAGSEGTPEMVGSGLVRLVANVLPVTAGLAVVTALARERMIELQLSLPVSFATTLARRAGLVLAAVTAASAVTVAGLMARGQWLHPAHDVTALLVPLGPAIFLAGTGACAVILVRSGAGAAAAVVVAWLMQLAVVDRLAQDWVVNRGLLVVFGAAALALACRMAADGELALKGVQA